MLTDAETAELAALVLAASPSPRPPTDWHAIERELAVLLSDAPTPRVRAVHAARPRVERDHYLAWLRGRVTQASRKVQQCDEAHAAVAATVKGSSAYWSASLMACSVLANEAVYRQELAAAQERLAAYEAEKTVPPLC